MIVQFIVLCLTVGLAPSHSSINDFEGDIILSPKQLKAFSKGRTAFLDPIKFWPDGTVYYQIDKSFSRKMEKDFSEALKIIHKHSCLTLVSNQHKNRDYINITKSDDGCRTELGYSPGVREMRLDPYYDCTTTPMILHHLLHALGFLHMHNSQERNNYITIVWENIRQEDWVHFQIQSDLIASTYGTDYDYKSIMHYPVKAYSKNRKRTIIPKQPIEDIGRGTTLSEGDILRLNRMYECK